MQKKQTINILENNEVRRDLTKKLVDLINSKLNEENKIKNEKVEEFLNDNKIIEQYKVANAIKEQQIKGEQIIKDLKDETKKDLKAGINRMFAFYMKTDGSKESNEYNKQIYEKACTDEGHQELTEEAFKVIFGFPCSKLYTGSKEENYKNYVEDPKKYQYLFGCNAFVSGGLVMNPLLEKIFINNKAIVEQGDRFMEAFESRANPTSLLIPDFSPTTVEEIAGLFGVREDIVNIFKGLNFEIKEFPLEISKVSNEHKYPEIETFVRNKSVISDASNETKEEFITYLKNNPTKTILDFKFFDDRKIMDKEVRYAEFNEDPKNVELKERTPEEMEKINEALSGKAVYNASEALVKFEEFFNGIKQAKSNFKSTHGIFTWNSKEFKDMEKSIEDFIKIFDKKKGKIQNRDASYKLDAYDKFFKAHSNTFADMLKKVQKYQAKKAKDKIAFEAKGKTFNDRTNRRLQFADDFTKLIVRNPYEEFLKKNDNVQPTRTQVQFKQEDFHEDIIFDLSKAKTKELETNIEVGKEKN